jgi:hypothetical protein
MVDRRVRGSGIGFGVDHQAIDKVRLDKEETGSESLCALFMACHIHIAVCNREIHAAAVLTASGRFGRLHIMQPACFTGFVLTFQCGQN